ncbi:hypothetical protein [Paenibacillus woosongensis]|uniref:Uncharacterized protein n=1 Tax=Paenibacillus woosongensis TaxID=307580 RepID=A0A7X3CP00_9BACL|nr:hypothetical protein [Paenibacillus woosongensis]MUG45510.1 hypothetical protein [Paenibacillus woosongensis]
MKKTLSIAASLIIGTSLSCQSAAALPPKQNQVEKKDSIEWVALWEFPKSREGQLERILTTELQRKILFALQEKQYLIPGVKNIYSFDPFKVTSMRQTDGGFYELDLIASFHKVTKNKIDKEAVKYQITFRHNYDQGFVVTKLNKIK